MSSSALRQLALRHGLAPGHETVTPSMEKTSAAFHVGALRGLFDTDGSVQGAQAKGVSVRLAQSDLSALQSAQRMLLRLGIASTIYQNRRPVSVRALPNGRGGRSDYATAAQHELVISGDNLTVFADRVGFSDTQKSERLTEALSSYRRDLNRERFTATVATV